MTLKSVFYYEWSNSVVKKNVLFKRFSICTSTKSIKKRRALRVLLLWLRDANWWPKNEYVIFIIGLPSTEPNVTVSYSHSIRPVFLNRRAGIGDLLTGTETIFETRIFRNFTLIKTFIGDFSHPKSTWSKTLDCHTFISLTLWIGKRTFLG